MKVSGNNKLFFKVKLKESSQKEVNMKKLILITFAIFLVTNFALAQKSFKKTYGGDNYDRGISAQQTSDKGYAIVGYTRSFGAGKDDVYLIKTDTQGSIQWSNAYGGKDLDNGWAVLQTSDDGFIITGFTRSFGNGGYDVYVVKTDATGKKQWDKAFGGKGDDRSWDMDKTSDKGFIIIGETNSSGAGERDALLLKIDDKGDQLWEKTYGGPKDDRCFSVRQTPDNGIIFTGITYSFGAGDRDVYVVKTDSHGKVLWEKTFGGNKSDVGHCVRLTSDGGYIVTGYTASFSKALNDIYLIKLDSVGNVKWTKTFGGEDDFHTLYGEETKDNGFILSGGIVNTRTRNMSACLVKTDNKGSHLWTRRFTEQVFKPITTARGYNGGLTNDGGYILAGDVFVYGSDTKSLVYFVKVDKNGN
jgi:hypothetical protein